MQATQYVFTRDGTVILDKRLGYVWPISLDIKGLQKKTALIMVDIRLYE